MKHSLNAKLNWHSIRTILIFTIIWSALAFHINNFTIFIVCMFACESIFRLIKKLSFELVLFRERQDVIKFTNVAWKEGIDAYNSGKKLEDNPYKSIPPKDRNGDNMEEAMCYQTWNLAFTFQTEDHENEKEIA